MTEQLLDVRPTGRYDKVEAAYDGLSDANRETFRRAIAQPASEVGHEAIAKALRALGYDVDRKQVHLFREKLSMGRVSL
ncbi:hypothetical protein J2X12_002913 [Pseudarthrobacter oxydans]|uniref:Uncharacterized protein n=1 Tax=Pseudarthrobacter oxydans TaxID=1671 RepID=A0AAW8NEV8_PSEOX|nr:hypothetical protein [Pseudarthrobacter oxydans]MDR6794350.1 hypothetical protein [Pseudarthrobacter oxydans]MDR7164875.1 hypothetical protein [Pseudarthrobacter oxydans]